MNKKKFPEGILRPITDPAERPKEYVEQLYDMSISDYAQLWRGAAEYPDDADVYDFKSLLEQDAQ